MIYLMCFRVEWPGFKNNHNRGYGKNLVITFFFGPKDYH